MIPRPTISTLFPYTTLFRSDCPNEIQRGGPRHGRVSLSRIYSVARQRAGRGARRQAARCRSEEHTSELQSLTKIVCRLLLEKKNSASERGYTWTSAGTSRLD